MEPAIEAEVVAKFTLFETFLATVVTIREETIKFWVENQGLFLGASKDAGQREIDAIDRRAINIVNKNYPLICKVSIAFVILQSRCISCCGVTSMVCLW